MEATLTLTAPANANGVLDLESQVEGLKHEFGITSTTTTNTATSGEDHDAVKLHKKTPANTRSREALEVIPGGEANAVTPEELAALMKPDQKTGKPIKKASARAALRILMIKAHKRIAAGAMRDKVVRVNFDDYDSDGAGRYYVEKDARTALDKYLASVVA